LIIFIRKNTAYNLFFILIFLDFAERSLIRKRFVPGVFGGSRSLRIRFSLSAFRLDRYRSRNGKAFEFPVALVAQKIVAKQHFRPDRSVTITASDAVAGTFGTVLTNHFYQL
jgi:hypothetical protein